MGALFFYIVVYLLGYYVCHVLNLLTVRPWIRNRYIAALIPVFLVGTVHAYYIISSPPPHSQDTSMGFALSFYIVMPMQPLHWVLSTRCGEIKPMTAIQMHSCSFLA